jgi:cis-3-alkyl-4-acyloxetan-2-one decarboxylase
MIRPLLPPDMPFWIGKMLPKNHIRYVIDVGDQQQMHVMEAGQGLPVLMVHGNPTWGFLYRRIMDRIADDQIRCIAPDLIGLGFSSKPRSIQSHTLENHARWLGTLIDQLGLDKDGLIFVGQDWGGPIGLRALAERSHLIKGMVILNTAITPPNPDFKPTAFHRFSRMPVISDMAFRIFGFPQNMLHKIQKNPDSISGNIARAYCYPLRKFRENLAPLALARMVPDGMDHPSVLPLQKCRALAESFSGPCEIVWGTKDPILGRALKRVRAVLPHARVTETAAGHFIQEEKPDLIAEAVKRVAQQRE